MSDLEKEKFLPIGSGKEAEPKETLPAIEVDNRVIWTNPDFPQAPFVLKEGRATELGLFLTPGKPEKNFPLKAKLEHGRSALLGQVVFEDFQGRFYRDLDLKGVGLITIGFSVGKIEKSDDRIQGILDKTSALQAKEMAEKFLRAGIRTERYLSLIELKEIVDEKGEKISTEEAERRGMIPRKVTPVLALRAFGTKYRISDAKWPPSRRSMVVEDARKMVSQELRIKEKDFVSEHYLEWFAKTLGENIGLMHKNDWHHSYLSSHNITLDCRIVDLDSVKSFHLMNKNEKERKMEWDWKEAKNSLYSLHHCLRVSPPDSYFKEIFEQSYIKNLGYEPGFIEEEHPKKE